MNIFYLHHNTNQCAVMHNDKHCVKMILEYAQILSTVHHRYNSATELMYKPTHRNHPSVIWAGDSYVHYLWLRNLLSCLCKEYTHRYGKIHAVERNGVLEALCTPPNISDCGFKPPPKCMPDECKLESTILSYRKYYIDKKASFCKWKNRQVPDWFVLNVA